MPKFFKRKEKPRLTPKQQNELAVQNNPALGSLQRSCSHPKENRQTPIVDGYDVEECRDCGYVFSESITQY